ncbi:hypothetical protein [Mesorhizobium sp. YM1C-6-2]|uniref:hypothetical protein n=1 Tax=Mesorhizobium sp. YM1C-6-2 TaxID=1827501 RepID=UPI000EF1B376|nr:hypothetical protein [Mesorhizobium sp. YM1C-6-2]RLP22261.1 hypothetical protein D8676_25310 [Mesorhizobium sp. YM1C-6-2]
MRRYEVTAVTDGDGAAEEQTPVVRGDLESIQYVKAGSGNYADGVDVLVTDAVTGETLWTGTNVNASAIVRPRAALHDTAGAAALYADAGEAVLGKIAISGRIKVAVSAGGAAKTGLFRFIVS